LIKREEDSSEKYQKRIKRYFSETTWALEDWGKQGALYTVDASKSKTEVSNEIFRVFDKWIIK
jgi:thymidylate kinase